MHSQVTVIASTNEPWAIDPGFLRPGRLGVAVMLGPLDLEGRRDFLLRQLQSQLVRVSQDLGIRAGCSEERLAAWVGLEAVARRTDGFTGADMQRLLTMANRALLEGIERTDRQGEAGQEGQRDDEEVISDDRLWSACLPNPAHFAVALSRMSPSVTREEVDQYLRWQSKRHPNLGP